LLLACLLALANFWAALAICGLALALWGQRAVRGVVLVFAVAVMWRILRFALALWW